MLQMHPGTETKFALYTSAQNSKGHNKLYYLTPGKSGAIMAEEGSSPDGCYHFSMSKATLPGSGSSSEKPDQQTITTTPSTQQPQVIIIIKCI